MSERRILRLSQEHLPSLCLAETYCFGKNAWSEAILRETLENRFSYFLGIFIDVPSCSSQSNDPIFAGYLAARMLGYEGELLSIAVLPEYRGCGLAEQLLLYWFASEPALREIFLEVRVGNKPAISLYEKLGFVSLGYRKNYYSHPREDALIMKKDFRPVSPGPIGAELFV